MKSYADKKTNNASAWDVNNDLKQQHDHAPSLSFIDNRSSAITQRKLAKAINASAKQAIQRQAASEEELQMKAAASVVQRVEDEEELLQGKFETAQRVEEEEELLQGKFEPVQRVEEDEELLQGKFEAAQRVEEEEELLQGKFETMQRVEEEEELLQGKFEAVQRVEDEALLQGKFSTEPTQLKPVARANNTGLPDNLKMGIENLSGYAMDDVKVHYNSDRPAQLNAHAYAQGTDIHLASGQEKHLPHEAWHVAQQKQGRVKPTMQMKGNVNINDDVALESEADVMGAKALQMKAESSSHGKGCGCPACCPVQRVAAKTVQLKCKICGAKSHSASKCPKREVEVAEESESGGRGLVSGGKAQRKMLAVLISKLDVEAMYDEGAKSLVGGKKGKPSGLKDKSVRIDRQGKGNVQFQIGDASYACVTFSEDTDPGAVIAALYQSFDSGSNVDL